MWKGLEKMHENQPKTSYMFMTLLDFSERFGAELVKETLAAFRCEKNQAVENFLRENAIDFSRKRQSITYVVLRQSDMQLVGYFSIIVKPLSVPAAMISKTLAKRIARVGELDPGTGMYSTAAYLIAQLGKNSALPKADRISGSDLLHLAMQEIEKISWQVGGTVQFLECEDVEFLRRFYLKNGFTWLGARTDGFDENEQPFILHQYIRKID